MAATGKHLSKTLRWIQWCSAVAALLMAVFIVFNNRAHRAEVAEQVLERHRLKMLAARDRIESYVGNIVRLCVRVMSLHPDVMEMDSRARQYLEALYKADYDEYHVAEIYILKHDFDGTHRPFMSFERGDDEHNVEELHAYEREASEYATLIEQIRHFADDETLDFLVSEAVPLCVGRPGRVYSVPIRSDGQLLGIVAGMVPSDVIAGLLEETGVENIMLLASGDGSFITSRRFPPRVDTWLRERFREETVAGFFEHAVGPVTAAAHKGLWTPADIPGPDKWYVATFYDEAADMRASGISSELADWGAAAVILLLGGGVAILWNVIHALFIARQDAFARATALAESEARTRAIVDGAAEGIVTINEHGIIEAFNAAAEHIFGFTAREVIGRNVSVLVPPPHRDRHDAYMTRYMKTGECNIIGQLRELEGQRKDGTTFPIELAVSEVRLPERRLFTGIIRDIRERRRAEEQARQRQAALAHATRLGTMGEMAGTLAHELNQPLFAIVNHVHACLERIKPGHADAHELLDDLSHAAAQARRAGGIIDRTRKFIRRKTPQRTWVDVNLLAREAAGLVACELHHAGVQLQYELTEPLAAVVAEPIQIQQVIVNLMRNAMEALRNNDKQPKRVIIRTSRTAEGGVDVAVQDTGPGLNGVGADRAFEPFFSTKRDGLGLGLSISRSIIEAHGGRLSAMANNGRGATFHFTLLAHNGDPEHAS